MRSGVGSVASFGWETAWAVPAPDLTELPILSESMRLRDPRIQDQSTYRDFGAVGAATWLRGKALITGQLTMPVWPLGMEQLWRIATGGYTWNGGSLLHEFKSFHLWEDRGWPRSFTMTVGTGAKGETDVWRTYAGCVVRGWRFNVRPDDAATVTFDVIAATEQTATSGPASTLGTVGSPWTGADVTRLRLAGASIGDVRRFEVSVDRQLDIAWAHGSDTIREPFWESTRPAYKAQATIELDSLSTTPAWYTLLYKGATPTVAAVDFRMLFGGSEFRVAAPAARVDGDGPTVGGPGPILVDVSMTLMAREFDVAAAPLTVSLTGTASL